MKKFMPSGGKICIANVYYEINEINTKTLQNKTTSDICGNQIDNKSGVYVFVVNRDISNFNIKYFNSEITGVFFKKNCPYTKEIGVPPFIKNPQKDCIFYVGSARQIVSRLKEHWNNEKINGCCSLKLGFQTRKWIRDFFKVYVIYDEGETKDNKTLEKEIRQEYGSSFGK